MKLNFALWLQTLKSSAQLHSHPAERIASLQMNSYREQLLQMHLQQNGWTSSCRIIKVSLNASTAGCITNLHTNVRVEINWVSQQSLRHLSIHGSIEWADFSQHAHSRLLVLKFVHKVLFMDAPSRIVH